MTPVRSSANSLPTGCVWAQTRHHQSCLCLLAASGKSREANIAFPRSPTERDLIGLDAKEIKSRGVNLWGERLWEKPLIMRSGWCHAPCVRVDMSQTPGERFITCLSGLARPKPPGRSAGCNYLHIPEMTPQPYLKVVWVMMNTCD